MLFARTNVGSRALVSCSRCGLLRFLAGAQPVSQHRFIDFILRRSYAQNLAGRLLRMASRAALAGPVSFLRDRQRKSPVSGLVLNADGADGVLSREIETQQARPLLITRTLADAQCAFHRHGVLAVQADPGASPIRLGVLDTVLRMQGLSGEPDPAVWLTRASRQLQPGGRIVLQVFDCSSWAFLLCGSRWVGLEPEDACYAYRGEDVEVLLDLCGMGVVRRSHDFPILNAFVWTSSLFPSLNAIDPAFASQPAPPALRTFAYLLLVAMLLPVAFLESLCHAGSVLMVEAERKS